MIISTLQRHVFFGAEIGEEDGKGACGFILCPDNDNPLDIVIRNNLLLQLVSIRRVGPIRQ